MRFKKNNLFYIINDFRLYGGTFKDTHRERGQ